MGIIFGKYEKKKQKNNKGFSKVEIDSVRKELNNNDKESNEMSFYGDKKYHIITIS